MLYCPGRIRDRYQLPPVSVHVIAALLKYLGMGINAADIIDFCIRMRYQVVLDAKHDLAHDAKIVFQEQIIIFMHASGQGIFQRNYPEIRTPLLYRFIDGLKRVYRHGADPVSEILVTGLVAVAAYLAEKCGFAFPAASLLFHVFNSPGLVQVAEIKLLVHHRSNYVEIAHQPGKLRGIQALGPV